MTNVVMPQMGESIAEGTIVRWIKKVGDSIDRDEPLFEISTDKVDAEIPSPAAGVLTEIKVKEGETVPVNSVVATIGGVGEVVARDAGAPPSDTLPEAAVGQVEEARTNGLPPSREASTASDEGDLKASFEAGLKDMDQEATASAQAAAASAKAATVSVKEAPTSTKEATLATKEAAPATKEAAPATKEATPATKEDLRRQKSSPLVRRIAHDHNVDLAKIQGTGLSGRVTKQDILGHIESGAAAAPAPARELPLAETPLTQTSLMEPPLAEPPLMEPSLAEPPLAEPALVEPLRAEPPLAEPPLAEPPRTEPPRTEPTPRGPAFKAGETVQIVPMSVMRRKIAEHMVLSAHTSPHVYSVYEVNFGRVSALREKKKAAYEAGGVKLTFTAIIAKVTVDALRQFPIVNASVDGNNIVYKKDINLGIAVALENGLIVPVIRNADEKNLLGLSRAINDIADRARSKKLNPDEVQGGTFTITNPGIFGALYGLPLINQPQVAILGVGSIERRAVVVEDAIAIRPVCHLTLGYDHRLVDGADAGRFLSFIKERLENFDEKWL
jgi:pyruvate dehydrogenase E2 component (dihydrolipoamide acetyltransferase)